MGGYMTRNRAWVYIAFYDEYAGKSINMAAGLSMLFVLPAYWYGIHCNRIKEQNMNALYYNFSHFDKRNRLTHNLIMEHFETHVEDFQDIIVDLQKEGYKALEGLEVKEEDDNYVTNNELALIDELSGFTSFTEEFITRNNVPEDLKERLRAHVVYFKEGDNGETRTEVVNKLYKKLYGSKR